VQIEQLQRIVPLERSTSASYRTAPQWQLPRTCFGDMGSSSESERRRNER